MNNLNKMAPYFIISLICYYGLPFFMQDSGSAIMILCIVLPLVTFLIAAFYGFQQAQHKILYAIITGAFFFPNIWIHMNDSAVIYSFIYMGFAFFGACMGNFLQKIKQQF